MSQLYLLEHQETSNSMHGGIIFKLYFIGVDDRKQYHTYVDPKNNNFDKWRQITANSGNGFILSGLKVKTKNLVTADSNVVVEHQFKTRKEAKDIVDKVWNSD